MDCRQASELVEKLLDGELDGEQRATTEAHLASCRRCESHKSFLERSASAMQTELAEPPAQYWESLPGRVLARIDAGAQVTSLAETPAPRVRASYPLIGLAATLLIAVTVAILARREGALTPLPQPMASRGASEEQTTRLDQPPAAPAATPPPTARDEAVLEEPRPSAEAASRFSLASDSEMAAPPSAAVAPAQAQAGASGADSGLADAARELASDDVPAAKRALGPSPTLAPSASGFRARSAASNAEPASVDCDSLREAVSRLGESDDEKRKRGLYDLARCSIGRFDEAGTSEAREIARNDILGFLAVEPEGTRASELERELARIQ